MIAQKLIVLALCSIVVIDAHTWLRCTDYKADGTCAGFIRNYHARDTPGDSTDEFYTNKLLGQDNEFLVCKADTQATPTYPAEYPQAIARAGSTLKTMYTPNGHSDEGDVGENTFARIHWNRGPDGPTGTLQFRKDLNASNELSRTNYAVNCQKTGNIASLPCVNPYTIPADTPPGVYQFVWYWPYNKSPTQRPFGEEYYSCFEINVVAPDASLPSTAVSSAPRTSRTDASSSETTPSSAPKASSASSSAARSSSTSRSSSAAKSSSAKSSSSRTSQSTESSQGTSAKDTSAVAVDLAADAHSNQVIAIGLLAVALLI